MGLVSLRHSKSTLTEHIEVFKIIPLEVKGILLDFFVLLGKTRNITLQRWNKEFGYLTKPLRESPDASVFEEDPVSYLVHAYRSVRDFPDRLSKNLHLLLLKRNEPLTVDEFEELVEYVIYEDAEKKPLTPKMVKVFRRGLLSFDPFIRRKRLAKHLAMSEDSIKWHIAEMKRRFQLYRLIEVDYYKLGLSKLYLFLRGFRDPNQTLNENLVKTLPVRYPLRAEAFPTGIAKQYVSYQIHTPPWNRRYDILHECKRHASATGVDFLTEEPDLFIATGRRCFYNLRSFDFKTGQWMINLRDLRFLINNSLMTGSLGVFPPYDFQFDVDRRQDKQNVIEFDELDLQICEKFWALEGKGNNRFASINAVSKALGVHYMDVAKRLKRLRAEQAVYFYYWSTLGLPTALMTLLITKDEFILNNFQSILFQLPVSSVVPLESLRDKETRGLLCQTYVPSDFALGPLLQTTFFAEESVLGFCAQAFPWSRAEQPLCDFYDPVRKWWKWDQVAIKKPTKMQEEDPAIAWRGTHL